MAPRTFVKTMRFSLKSAKKETLGLFFDKKEPGSTFLKSPDPPPGESPGSASGLLEWILTKVVNFYFCIRRKPASNNRVFSVQSTGNNWVFMFLCTQMLYILPDALKRVDWLPFHTECGSHRKFFSWRNEGIFLLPESHSWTCRKACACVLHTETKPWTRASQFCGWKRHKCQFLAWCEWASTHNAVHKWELVWTSLSRFTADVLRCLRAPYKKFRLIRTHCRMKLELCVKISIQGRNWDLRDCSESQHNSELMLHSHRLRSASRKGCTMGKILHAVLVKRSM